MVVGRSVVTIVVAINRARGLDIVTLSNDLYIYTNIQDYIVFVLPWLVVVGRSVVSIVVAVNKARVLDMARC